jgi:hypothetical protein
MLEGLALGAAPARGAVLRGGSLQPHLDNDWRFVQYSKAFRAAWRYYSHCFCIIKCVYIVEINDISSSIKALLV